MCKWKELNGKRQLEPLEEKVGWPQVFLQLGKIEGERNELLAAYSKLPARQKEPEADPN